MLSLFSYHQYLNYHYTYTFDFIKYTRKELYNRSISSNITCSNYPGKTNPFRKPITFHNK